MAIQVSLPGKGLSWADLPGGIRTDSSATAASSSNSIDGGASSSTGFEIYYAVTAFTGTSATLTLFDSSDNSSFAAVTGAPTWAITGAPATLRATQYGAVTLRRYVAIASSGTFTVCSFTASISR